MKLELKHIASYLPYDVFVYDKRQSSKIDGVVGLYYDTIDFANWSPVDSKIENYKLVLRPLSDLTKEIDGVAHLVELAKIEHPCSVYHELHGDVVEVAGDNGNSLSFRFEKDEIYFMNSEFDCDDVYYPILYQIDLFEYLFQHHFDVYGLIEKGLAVDINTIENV